MAEQFDYTSQQRQQRLQQNMNMEKPSSSAQTLKRYYQLTSPISTLHMVKQHDQLKQQLTVNATLRLDCIKNRNNKPLLPHSPSLPELKAAALLYQVPEFSVPEVNFEVADQIKRKVDEVKNEMVNYLPQISKPSNYAPRKLEQQLGHRSAVRELEEWLRTHLRDPPTAAEDTIDYKNMIMGVGMKELIRLISRRCNEQGRVAEQIWELTWSICREIILYLSKRAKKCEALLDEELALMRMASQKEFERLTADNLALRARLELLEQTNAELETELGKSKRRGVALEEENRNLYFSNFHLQEQFRNVLEENLAIYLQVGDKSKRGWVKKMYKNIAKITANHTQAQHDSNGSSFTQLFSEQVVTTIENRNKTEQVTGEVTDSLNRNEIEAIGTKIIQEVLAKHNKPARLNTHTSSQQNNQNDTQEQFFTQPPPNQQTPEDNHSESESDNEQWCKGMVTNMREEFMPADCYVQTDEVLMVHAYAGTTKLELSEAAVQVSPYYLGLYSQNSMNTQEVKEEKVVKKKVGKQNPKEDTKNRQKSKLYSNPPLTKDKSRMLKDTKKSVLEVVEQDQKETNRLPTNNNIFLVPFDQNNRFSIATNSDCPSPKDRLSTDKHQLTKTESVTEEAQSKQTLQLKKTRKQSSKEDKVTTNSSFLLAKTTVNKQTKIQQNRRQSTSFDEDVRQQMEIINQEMDSNSLQATKAPITSKTQNLNAKLYICAECNKQLKQDEQKYEYRQKEKRRNKQNTSPNKNNENNKKNEEPSDSPVEHSLKDLAGFERRDNCDYQGRSSLRKNSRRSSGYLHDLAYKKEIQAQNKSPFFQHTQPQDRTEQEEDESAILTKVRPQKLLTSQLFTANKDFISAMGNSSQGQSADSLDQYLEMVRQVNSFSEGKATMTEKTALSVIEKNLLPILNELLGTMRKAVKANKIPQTMRNFTSLPSILCNRINRKYGVKILAVKHLRVILLAVKTASKYTERFKTIELMMFTDCKSPHSEDLFVFLLLMGLFDPNYSANRLLAPEEALTVRRICEQHLTREPSVYADLNPNAEGLVLNELVRSIITNYRLLKINRIEELGFVYLMLRRDQQWVSYRDLLAFLAPFSLEHPTKLALAKRLLEYCDVRIRDQTIGITENMFSKFLTACDTLTLPLLERNLQDTLLLYAAHDTQRLSTLMGKLYSSVTELPHTASNPKLSSPHFNSNKQLELDLVPQLTHTDSSPIIPQAQDAVQTPDSPELPSNIIDDYRRNAPAQLKVPQQLRTYSPFTYQICNYLERTDQTKFLTPRQRTFIKNYLLLHVLETELEKLVGIADYFSNSMLGFICTPLQEYSIAHVQQNE